MPGVITAIQKKRPERSARNTVLYRLVSTIWATVIRKFASLAELKTVSTLPDLMALHDVINELKHSDEASLDND